MMSCVYCGPTTNKKSREHIISETVLKELYGEKINNWFSAKKNLEWKWLKNHNNEVVKDVCKNCNTTLSNLGIDNAGRYLIQDIDKYHRENIIKLRFNQTTLWWIIKTHLNQLRRDSLFIQKGGQIGKNIYKSLILGERLDNNLFSLMVQAADVPPEIWIAKQRPSSLQTWVSIINGMNVLISVIRIRYLFTYLLLPIDGNYKTFLSDLGQAHLATILLEGGSYAEVLDLDKVLKNRILELHRKLPREQFIKGLYPLEDFKKLFNN